MPLRRELIFGTANARRLNLYASNLPCMPAEENLRDSVELGAINDAEESRIILIARKRNNGCRLGLASVSPEH